MKEPKRLEDILTEFGVGEITTGPDKGQLRKHVWTKDEARQAIFNELVGLVGDDEDIIPSKLVEAVPGNKFVNEARSGANELRAELRQAIREWAGL